MPYKRLKKKLKAHGVNGKLLAWIAAWLSNRKQRVVLNGREVTWQEVLSSVLKGSVLGPLLFIIFINDLDMSVSEPELLFKFVDNTKVARVINRDQDRQGLQHAMDRLIDWSERWGMLFNVSKRKVIHAGRNNEKKDYVMNGTTLDSMKEEKGLGVAISDMLKPAAQCAKAAKTALGVLGQITRAFQYRDKKNICPAVSAIYEATLGVCCAGVVALAAGGQGHPGECAVEGHWHGLRPERAGPHHIGGEAPSVRHGPHVQNFYRKGWPKKRRLV
jgi:ribonucleases P/MRP protein subunit RPP40